MAKDEVKQPERIVQKAPGKFKRGKALVLPSLSIAKMETGESLFVRFDTQPVTKPQTILSGADKGKPKKDPDTGEDLTITTAQVCDLTTGAIGEMVLTYMMCKGLAPLGDLTGKKFEFVKGKKKNRTNEWEVYELTE